MPQFLPVQGIMQRTQQVEYSSDFAQPVPVELDADAAIFDRYGSPRPRARSPPQCDSRQSPARG